MMTGWQIFLLERPLKPRIARARRIRFMSAWIIDDEEYEEDEQPADLRTCSRCGEDWPSEMFARNGFSATGTQRYYSYCRRCSSEDQRRRRVERMEAACVE